MALTRAPNVDQNSTVFVNTFENSDPIVCPKLNWLLNRQKCHQIEDLFGHKSRTQHNTRRPIVTQNSEQNISLNLRSKKGKQKFQNI